MPGNPMELFGDRQVEQFVADNFEHFRVSVGPNGATSVQAVFRVPAQDSTGIYRRFSSNQIVDKKLFLDGSCPPELENGLGQLLTQAELTLRQKIDPQIRVDKLTLDIAKKDSTGPFQFTQYNQNLWFRLHATVDSGNGKGPWTSIFSPDHDREFLAKYLFPILDRWLQGIKPKEKELLMQALTSQSSIR